MYIRLNNHAEDLDQLIKSLEEGKRELTTMETVALLTQLRDTINYMKEMTNED